MCRKGFNPERIKKLHVDKAPEGAAPTGPVAEENGLLRRVGMLFDEGADPADVYAMKAEALEWLNNHPGSSVSFPPISSVVYATSLTKRRTGFSMSRYGTPYSPFTRSSLFA